MMPSCQKVTELLSAAKDEPLPWGQRMSLRFHLAMCDACRNFSDQLDELQTISSRYLEMADTDEHDQGDQEEGDLEEGDQVGEPNESGDVSPSSDPDTKPD